MDGEYQGRTGTSPFFEVGGSSPGCHSLSFFFFLLVLPPLLTEYTCG